MTQALPAVLTFRTFEEFLEWYPEGRGRYELIDGVVVEMNPTGDHEEVVSQPQTECSHRSPRFTLFHS
jgi:Uma2 family endonuclease